MAAIARMLVRRVLILIPMLLGVVLFVFLIMRFSKNKPEYAYFQGANPTAAQIHQFQVDNGLLDPLPVRYVRFVGQLLHGDMGTSALTKAPVRSSIATALPLTLQLTLFGVVIAIVLSVLFGVIAAIFRDRWPDQVIRVLSMAGVAMPSFWLGILLIQWFALRLGWFPTGGYVNPGDSIGGWLRSLALPALAVGFPVGSLLARVVRTAMVEELDRDYVRTAIGGGLPRFVVVGRNVLRNALITPLTVLGLQIGYLLSGAVVVEAIFGLPGLGTLIMQGVTAGDPALVQGVVLCIALTFLVVNLLVDVLYLFANPRLKGVTR